MSNGDEGLVSINEGFQILGVSRRTIYTYIKDRKLTLTKKGNRSFLNLNEINQLKKDMHKKQREKSRKRTGRIYDRDKFVMVEKSHYESLLRRLEELCNEIAELKLKGSGGIPRFSSIWK